MSPSAPAAEPQRPSQDRILDAAEAVVARDGSGGLTIDAVVRESGFSKGGVLYNFPSKRALIEGMLRRKIDQLSRDIDAVVEDARTRDAPVAPAVIALLLSAPRKDNRVGAGLLAAVAEQPELVEIAREVFRRTSKILLEHAPDRTGAQIALAAVDGLHFDAMFNLRPLSDSDRAALEAALLRLVTEPSL